ncbi:MAG TPA: hypothetical protein VGY56_11380 [Verrucomicrobiae bacterium]|nr:hypothetical protein [Verrucomicrobiae bacterium]
MTATLPKERKRGPRIRGICADAEILGCTPEHLALVLRGKRKSEPLQARYQALKQSQQQERMKPSARTDSPATIPMPIELAALQNLQPSFFKTLTTLGFEVLIVRFEAGKDSAIWLHDCDSLAAEIGDALTGVKAGEFDSSFYPLGAQWHFYQVRHENLGPAVRQIKDCLAARGLLNLSQIFHAESAEILREYYPGTAAECSAETVLAHSWDGDTLTLKNP